MPASPTERLSEVKSEEKGRFFSGIQEYKLRTEEGRKAGERLANLVDKLQQQVLSIFNQDL